jgi:structural maintenance of chromosome 1
MDRKKSFSQKTAAMNEKVSNLETLQLSRKENHLRFQQSIENYDSKKSTLSLERSGLVTRRDTQIAHLDILSSAAENAKREVGRAERTGATLTHRENETMERLGITSEKLQSARYDASESDRVVKFNECLSALKRMYPGVYGRLVDLCTPVMKKYEDALGVVLGKNLDAIVVDTFSIGKQCLEVSCIHVLTTLVFQGAASRQRYIHSS